MSFAVRKMDEPIIPPTSSSTESSRLSPRTREGCVVEKRRRQKLEQRWWGNALSDSEFVRILQRRATTPADNRGAVPAGEWVSHFFGASGAIKRSGLGSRKGFWGLVAMRRKTVTQPWG